jgi:uncharacterized caspase-like protein
MRALIACVSALVMLTATVRADVPRRVALVIGNQAYQSLSTLANPRLDAGKLAELLAANGFDVMSCDGQRPGCFDLKRADLQDALETFRDKASGAELALVFYAGHGMEGSNGNVLAPIDMEVIDCTKRALRRGVPLAELWQTVAGARKKIVILDACRNDPFARCPPTRGMEPVSFAPLSAPEAESFLLVLSTKPGQTAKDGPPGAHSPYARALLAWLEKEPAVYFHDVLSQTAKEVIEATNRTNFTQVPEMVARGQLPAACLKGEGCAGDARSAALDREVAELRQQHTRDQELLAAFRDLSAAAKDVGQLVSEGEKARGRPFSTEDLAHFMEAGRLLAARNDTAPSMRWSGSRPATRPRPSGCSPRTSRRKSRSSRRPRPAPRRRTARWPSRGATWRPSRAPGTSRRPPTPTSRRHSSTLRMRRPGSTTPALPAKRAARRRPRPPSSRRK